MLYTGWIFDVYPTPQGLTIWIIDPSGRSLNFFYPFQPSFFLHGTERTLKNAVQWIERQHIPVQFEVAQKREFYTNDWVSVVSVRTLNPLDYTPLVQAFLRQSSVPDGGPLKPPGTDFGAVEIYNCDIPLPQLFFYESELFPLAKVELEAAIDSAAGEGAPPRILGFELLDSPRECDYPLPPLRVLQLKLENSSHNPAHGGRSNLVTLMDDREIVLEGDHLITHLNKLVERADPHLVLTDWGDSYILPRLYRLARQERTPLKLDRKGEPPARVQKERSYFSYGRIVHVDAIHTLRGRWHIDRRNSFIAHESGLEGLFELARLSKIPVQRLARLSTGTCISSMQVEVALRENYLVPYRKHVAEDFKDGLELLTIDKGGLTYAPILGFHDQVAELDFASMYPTLMRDYNLSPETINCACCPDAPRVPETGYRMCQQRRGLVPKALDLILEKRRLYKQKKRAALTRADFEINDRKQTALKWVLVTCFGYLGYKNARFGRIEAHESTTAYGREILLLAKEVAERAGYHMLHALTDALWVHKPGATAEDFEDLAGQITRQTRIPIALEGVYRWIAFAPSRRDARVSVPNRYFGLFESGELKVRGIELRRSDTPMFIKQFQARALEVWSSCRSREECRQRVPEILKEVETRVAELQGGQMAPEELAISLRISRDPLDYKVASLTAIVSQELTARGVSLSPGERIQCIITDADAALPCDRAKALAHLDGTVTYDREKYEEFLFKAAESLLIHFGWTFEKLKKQFGQRDLPEHQRRIPRGNSRTLIPTPVPCSKDILFEFSPREKQTAKIAK
ncbi:MAG: DNA polymerase domain-containing protein [Terriglobia bacterium]